LAKMFMTSYKAPIQTDSDGVHYMDLSAMGADYRAVDIDIYNYTGTVDSDGHCHEFTGVSSYTSDLFIQGEEGECAYIALYKDQSISKLTDAIRITWGGNYGGHGIQYYIVSKQNSYIDLSNSNAIFTAPWVFAKHPTGRFGYIGTNKRGGNWDFEWNFVSFGNRTQGYYVYPSSIRNLIDDVNRITIRCPDYIRKGSFIGIACDTPKESYIDFTCTLSGNNSERTKLMELSDKSLRLQCGSDETSSELLIEAVSASNPNLKTSKRITVLPYGWSGEWDSGGDSGGGDSGGGDDGSSGTSSLVTDIALSVNPDTVVPGGHSIIEVSVNGTGDYSQAFTAQLSGHTSPDTHLVAGSNSCNLWVGEDETASSVLVTVSSVQDPSITAVKTIYIDQSGAEEDEATTAQQLQQTFWRGYATARAYFQRTKLSEFATIRISADYEPSTDAEHLKRAFWKGFVACLGTLGIIESDSEIIATLTDGVLYIKNAPVILNENTLEVGKW